MKKNQRANLDGIRINFGFLNGKLYHKVTLNNKDTLIYHPSSEN